MLQHGTCYARPIYPPISAYHFYKGHVFHSHFKRCTLRYCIDELIQENTHVHRCLVAEKPAGVFYSSRSAGAWNARAKDKKTKERTGHRKSSRTLRRSFPSPSPSCARVAVSNFSSMTRGQNLMFGTNVELFAAAAAAAVWQLRTKWCRSWWWLFRVVGYVIFFRSTASKSADCILWAYIYLSQ